MGHVSHIGEERRVLARNHEGKNHFEDLSVQYRYIDRLTGRQTHR